MASDVSDNQKKEKAAAASMGQMGGQMGLTQMGPGQMGPGQMGPGQMAQMAAGPSGMGPMGGVNQMGPAQGQIVMNQGQMGPGQMGPGQMGPRPMMQGQMAGGQMMGGQMRMGGVPVSMGNAGPAMAQAGGMNQDPINALQNLTKDPAVPPMPGQPGRFPSILYQPIMQYCYHDYS